MATVPKASGEINRANIADTTRETIIPEYFSMADQNTPCNISCLIDIVKLSVISKILHSVLSSKNQEDKFLSILEFNDL